MSELKCSVCKEDGKEIIYGFHDIKTREFKTLCADCGMRYLEEREAEKNG